MNIITGRTGEPHVTAQQDRDIYAGILGDGMYVLPVGEKLVAEQQSGNTIRIKDGTLMLQGCAASIDAGNFEDLTIENGTSGMQRIDLITAHYHRDSGTGYESMELRVIRGTAVSSNPKQPSYMQGTIRDGAADVEMPLYSVAMNGVSIASITPLFNVMGRSLFELAKSQKIIWQSSTGYYMNSGQTINLSEAISEQPNGIVLVWCDYTGSAAQNAKFSWDYIPKAAVLLSLIGQGGSTFFNAGFRFSDLSAKYLYITDTTIRGSDYNSENGTQSGITYDNRNTVLRYVLGV